MKIVVRIATFFLLVLLFQTVSLQAQNQVTVDTVVRNLPEGAEVKPFGQILFYFYADYGPLTARQRATFMDVKIRALAEDPFFSPDSLKIVQEHQDIGIIYRGEMFTMITAGDSVAENRLRMSIAKERRETIVNSLNQYIEAHSQGFLLKSIIYSVIILFSFIFLVVLINRLFRIVKPKLSVWIEVDRKIFYFKDYEFFNKRRQLIVLQVIVKIFRFFIIITLFVIALGFMFYLLPWTKFHTLHFLDHVLNPVKSFFQAILRFIPDFITICVIVFITVWIVRLFRYFKQEIEAEALKLPGFYPEWALPTFNIIRVAIWIFAVIVIWPYIPGSDSKIFQGISVFLGLVFSFTSASLISNLMAGFSLTYTRAFRIGDRIRVGEAVGDVIEKSMLVTKIRTVKNEEITIPNSKIMSSEVINYNAESGTVGLILYTSVTIGYDAPWRQIHQLLIDAALSTNGLQKDPPPFVLQTSLDDFYIAYQINGYTKEPNRMAAIYSELHQNIQDKFNEAGVEIMSPHYGALRDGNTIAIPENYRSPGYHSPNFKVGQ